MQENNTTTTNSNDRSAMIDAAIAKAKAARAARLQAVTTEASAPATKNNDSADKSAERAAKKALREQEREARNAERAARKAAKAQERAEKNASKQPAHMTKVLKAAARLPQLDEQTSAIFTQIEPLTADQKLALAEHIRHNVRFHATQQALETQSSLKVGQTVIVTGGDPKLVGVSGKLTSVRRIRCLVQLESGKEAYLFLSDVAPVAQEEETATTSAQEEAEENEQQEEQATEVEVELPVEEEESDEEADDDSDDEEEEASEETSEE